MIHFVLFFFKKQKLARVLEHYRYQVTIEDTENKAAALDQLRTMPTQVPLVIPDKPLVSLSVAVIVVWIDCP